MSKHSIPEIEEKLKALKASYDTVSDKIKRLGTFYSYLQVRIWRKQRALIKSRIKYYENLLK